jgi:ketosteroid isomerase-like protein
VSERNVEVVRALYAAFNDAGRTGDFASYVEKAWDPECEYQPVEEYELIRGHAALVAWNERWFEAWEESHADVEEVIGAEDGAVFSAVTLHAAGKDGMKLAQRFFHVLTVRDGRVLSMREYVDRDEALQEAGLRDA